jgi:dTDP-4-dehydrorhamnose reductase
VRLLVLGAAGMLGRDVVAAAANEHDVVALGHSELDVTDAAAVSAAVAAARPDAVLNCAAYTDVDGAEREPDAALAVNRDGARNAAAAAAELGAKALYVSSDYVFDGSKRAPYVESDPTAPLSSYGRSKLAGERATAAANARHFVVRSSWLFGAGGRNFVATMLSLARERDELRVVDDQVGCPTYTADLAQALVRIVAGERFGLHHAAGGGACSWYDLARAALELAGVATRVEPCTTADFPRPAPRPAYSVLRSERPDAVRLPAWRDGLERYLAERAVRA